MTPPRFYGGTAPDQTPNKIIIGGLSSPYSPR